MGWGLSSSTDMLGAFSHSCRTTFTSTCVRTTERSTLPQMPRQGLVFCRPQAVVPAPPPPHGTHREGLNGDSVHNQRPLRVPFQELLGFLCSLWGRKSSRGVGHGYSASELRPV